MHSTAERPKRKYTPREPYARSCDWCSKEYLTASYASKFCAPKCRESMRYYTQREARLASSKKRRDANREAISARRRELRLQNIERHKAMAAVSYRRNRDKRLAEAKQYQKDRPDVAARTRNKRKSAVSFEVTARDFQRMLIRAENKCSYCRVTLASFGRAESNSLQWDHILPLSKGGTNGIGNLAPSCRDCNRNKSAKLLIEWRNGK